MTDLENDSTTTIDNDIADLSDVDNDMTVNHPNDEGDDDNDNDDNSDDEPEVGRPEENDEKEDDEEEEDPDEEEEEPVIQDIHPFTRPTVKEINEKFPEFFKRFPSMKDMYYREAEYSKIFPTIDDAKEAGENDKAFQSIREDVFEGDGTKFFSAIKEAGDKSLEEFGSKILPALFKVSPESFWKAANPFVEDIARSMFNKGVKEKDENLQNAARYLADHFLGDVAFAEGKKTTVVKIEKDDTVKKEREEFDREKHTTFATGVQSNAKVELLKLIDSPGKNGKSRLDPDGVLSPFIKATIIDRIVADIGSQLESDKNHNRFMDSLWNSAKKNGRTDEDKSRIVSAYLARAKGLIPILRSKYVSEALGKTRLASDKKKEKVDRVKGRHGDGESGRNSGVRSPSYNPRSIDYRKTSDLDILNGNITNK